MHALSSRFLLLITITAFGVSERADGDVSLVLLQRGVGLVSRPDNDLELSSDELFEDDDTIIYDIFDHEGDSLLQLETAVKFQEIDTDGCDPPKLWIEETDLHARFPQDEIEAMIANGTLESRQNPDVENSTQHSVKHLVVENVWMSEEQLHEMFDNDAIQRMMKSFLLQGRKNPKCPQQTQYVKRARRRFTEQQLYRRFGQVFQDLLLRGIVEPTKKHAEYFLHPKQLKSFLNSSSQSPYDNSTQAKLPANMLKTSVPADGFLKRVRQAPRKIVDAIRESLFKFNKSLVGRD